MFLEACDLGSWGMLESLCKAFFSQTVTAEGIVSEPGFDQLPVASQYVSKTSSQALNGSHSEYKC